MGINGEKVNEFNAKFSVSDWANPDHYSLKKEIQISRPMNNVGVKSTEPPHSQ